MIATGGGVPVVAGGFVERPGVTVRRKTLEGTEQHLGVRKTGRRARAYLQKARSF